MTVNRRRALRLTGTVMSGAILAGCLSADTESDGDEPNGTSDGPDGPSDEPNGTPDEPNGEADELSIDGRLHNEAGTARTFAVTIRDDTDAVTAEDERLVEPGATAAIPGIASPGESRTITVSVDGATATEPFAFDVEATPGTKDGDVDITYTADGAVEIAFAPFEVPPSDGGHAAVDEPPYEITVPSCGPDGSRDPLWLCENMPAEPTLEFEQEATSSVILRDEGLAFQTDGPGSQFYATFLTEAGDLERVDRNASGPTAELIESTAFESAAILVAQTGWGSGTITPHLERLEPTDDGIHAFGCYRRPCAGTDDYTVRTVVARFERPDALETGSVSLTVDPETRVRFEVGDGVVSLPDGR